MKKEIIRTSLDLNNLPRLTAEQEAELAALGTMKDEDIDYSDAPSLDLEKFAKAVRNPYFSAPKESTTVRIDKDVMDWLRSGGKGYQTRINMYLRLAMMHSLKASSEIPSA